VDKAGLRENVGGNHNWMGSWVQVQSRVYLCAYVHACVCVCVCVTAATLQKGLYELYWQLTTCHVLKVWDHCMSHRCPKRVRYWTLCSVTRSKCCGITIGTIVCHTGSKRECGT